MNLKRWNGFCLIPIRKTQKSYGYVKDIITNNKSYRDILRYANRNSLCVIYLSFSHGIVMYDDYLTYERYNVKMYGQIGSAIVAEQIYRLCLEYSMNKIYIMNTDRLAYRELNKRLKNKGIIVYNPIEGYKRDYIRNILNRAII